MKGQTTHFYFHCKHCCLCETRTKAQKYVRCRHCGRNAYPDASMPPHTVPVARENAKERPIIFTGPLVRAIMEGAKTQTRRVVKVRAPGHHTDRSGPVGACPYGIPGDHLWVRETWTTVAGFWDGSKAEAFRESSIVGMTGLIYRADNDDKPMADRHWRPPIFMPRWASRIQLEVVSVRAEFLCNITNKDAIDEGCAPACGHCINVKATFRALWDRINAKRNGGRYAWRRNPRVWAVEFKRI